MKVIFEKAKSLFSEWYDSPLEFLSSLIVTAVILGVWGLVMGLMEEYR